MQQVSQQDIAARAYQLWEEEGRPHGRDLDHWSKATSELGTNGNSNGHTNGAGNGETAQPLKKASSKAKATVEPEAPAAPKATKKPAKSKK